MSKRFTCRGFEGIVELWPPGADGPWFAFVAVAGVTFKGDGRTASIAKARVRRKLDAVERVFLERDSRRG